MFGEKIKTGPFCWVEYKVLYLPLLNKYLGENFFKRGDCYYIKDGGYISRMVSGYGLFEIDANELVSEITVWFCEALQDYNFEELITENFEVERDAYTYNKLKCELHNYLKFMRVRYRPIPEKKLHKMKSYMVDDYTGTGHPTQHLELDLSVLNPTEKLVIDSFYFENLTIKQVADIIGKSEKTVKRIKTASLQKLSSNIKSA